MSKIFSNCKSLFSLPDISKWNTNNIKSFYCLFFKCFLLKYIPNISIWNTSNVTNMGFLFSYCSSLIKLPDISNWDVNNVKNIGGIFSGCSSLKCLPNLSKWFNNSKIIDNPIFNENILLEVDYHKYYFSKEENTKNTRINFSLCFMIVHL